MKTVLAPGAPWPYKAETPKVEKPKPKKRLPPPPKKASKIQKTDAKYIEWAGRNL